MWFCEFLRFLRKINPLQYFETTIRAKKYSVRSFEHNDSFSFCFNWNHISAWFNYFLAPAAYQEKVLVCQSCHTFLNNRLNTATEIVEWTMTMKKEATLIDEPSIWSDRYEKPVYQINVNTRYLKGRNFRGGRFLKIQFFFLSEWLYFNISLKVIEKLLFCTKNLVI